MFQGCKSLCHGSLRLQSKVQSRCMSSLTKAEARKRRNLLFDEEKKKQREAIGRIQKVDVKYQSAEDEIVFAMNKHLSTPYDCARHLSEGVTKVSALAMVDGNIWDMHKPFTSDCELKFLNLLSPKTLAVNTAFWRTCSFIMGAMVEMSFKPEIEIHAHSFPSPNIKSGSFVYDVVLNLPEWQPTVSELRAMSAQFMKIVNKDLPLERLVTTESVALDMFQENPYKVQQIPNIAKANNNEITLYRVGEHVDITKGPLVGNTHLIGRATVTSIHKLESGEDENMYRFQGIALPKGVRLNQFAYGLLEERARKLNNAAWIPHTIIEETDQVVQLSAKN